MLPSGYTNIPLNEECPSIEEIKTTERVLKYCAAAKGMSIPDFNVIEILKKTTNILRWFRGQTPLNFTYPPYNDKMYVLCIHHDKLVIVDIEREDMNEWENNCQQFYEIIRLANPQDKYPHVNIYGKELN